MELVGLALRSSSDSSKAGQLKHRHHDWTSGWTLPAQRTPEESHPAAAATLWLIQDRCFRWDGGLLYRWRLLALRLQLKPVWWPKVSDKIPLHPLHEPGLTMSYG